MFRLVNKGHKIDTSSRVRITVANAAPTIKKKMYNALGRHERMITNDHVSWRVKLRCNVTQMQSQKISSINCTGHPTEIRGCVLLRRTQFQLGELINEQKNNLLPRIYDFYFSNI